MNPPRLLAIDDVYLTGPVSSRDALVEFYLTLMGFERGEGDDRADRLLFRGVPRSGPRLIVDLLDEPADKPLRRQALVQVDELGRYAEALAERRVEYGWTRGWFFFDRRIGVLDPAGNWLELVSSHHF